MNFEIIAVDFDGTICEDRYPEIGDPNNEVIRYLKEKQASGVKLILWTCRVDERLSEAAIWCQNQGLIFDTVNENIPEAIEMFGNDTRKIFAHEYIDDRMSNRFELPYRTDYNCKACQYPYCEWVATQCYGRYCVKHYQCPQCYKCFARGAFEDI